MTFIQCGACGVFRIPADLLQHTRVPPDPLGNLSLATRLLLRMRMTWLKSQIPDLDNKSRVFLDVGCGDGQFLHFLREMGYENAYGIEPDPARAKNARKRGVEVFANLEDFKEQTSCGSIDFVFSWHVLEHVTRPGELVDECLELLSPNGAFIVSVPNHKSLQTRLFGYFSAWVDYGRHVWYHDPTYVEWLGHSFPGHSVKRLRDFNYEYEVAAWIDSWISAAFRQQNFVHRVLKKGQGGRIKKIFVGLTSVLLIPIAFLASILSLMSGNGSTLNIAFKPLREVRN